VSEHEQGFSRRHPHSGGNVERNAFRQFATENRSAGVPALEGGLTTAVSAAIFALTGAVNQHRDDRLAVAVQAGPEEMKKPRRDCRDFQLAVIQLPVYSKPDGFSRFTGHVQSRLTKFILQQPQY
jgi:hypothetical protein